MMGIDTDIKLLKNTRTKIIATLGPASYDEDVVEELIIAGIDVFRLNMSHGTHEGHKQVYEKVRKLADKHDKPIAVLADLCGPKIRVGNFTGGQIKLTNGEKVTITMRDIAGYPGVIPSQYKELAQDVKQGSTILLDDGNIELSVDSVQDSEISCYVVHGGVLRDHKGMNLPDVDISTPSLTEKDRSDARFALDLGVDFLALSFVRRAQDVHDLRQLINEQGQEAHIISKIEKPEALKNIDDIIDASDGLMIARGDLGVELPPQSVPFIQEQLIIHARKARKPVIVATQMLESMIEHSRPTRAEVTDVAHAVRSGADAVMLSAETAAGKYPVEAVRMMDIIARQTEGALWKKGAFELLRYKNEQTRPIAVEDALADSTAQLSRDLLVRSIVVISQGGHSVAVMSASRPAAPILALLPETKISRIANLLWGVIPVTVGETQSNDLQETAKQIVQKYELASEGQIFLIVRGFSPDPSQNQPSVTVASV
jgi:pyruvate kinase